jgi:hypothetical protein
MKGNDLEGYPNWSCTTNQAQCHQSDFQNLHFEGNFKLLTFTVSKTSHRRVTHFHRSFRKSSWHLQRYFLSLNTSKETLNLCQANMAQSEWNSFTADSNVWGGKLPKLTEHSICYKACQIHLSGTNFYVYLIDFTVNGV